MLATGLATGLTTGTAFGVTGPALAQRRGDEFEIASSETATIDGRHWDTPIVGGLTVDAVHRSVLLRFPTAGDEISGFLREGRVLARAELVMSYGGYEIVPDGYLCRDGLGRKLWTDDPPTWHIEAFPLRRLWIADRDHGPTFNASANGLRYWSRYGASDTERDRVPGAMAPQELSIYAREARFDITPLLATAVVEREAGARLRWLQESGFLLRKVEIYDSRYRQADNAYEWAMPTGGHGLSFVKPRLVLTGRPTSGIVSIVMPPAFEADWQVKTADGSRPTAVMPSAQQVSDAGRRATLVRGDRPKGEIDRIAELRRAGGDNVSALAEAGSDKGYKAYLEQIRLLLSMPPRYWVGWSIEDYVLIWYQFRSLLAPPVQDHLKAYWTAWLQPDLPTSAFAFPQGADSNDYWRRNRDWRGRASFFRDGFNFAVSTQNFNHTAAMGALLGGAMIGSDHAMGDGRHGLETLLLRFWGFLDGGTQEVLDHYYLSITLSGQKMFADFAPAPVDRLMGRILVDRTMEILVSYFHPALRRFVASSGRARLSGVLVEQDGIYGALHTVSKRGAIKYADQPADATVHGMPVWGYDFPPGRVAIQSLQQPWAPAWVSGLIDDKPVPFEHTSTETIRGFFKPPLWRRSYLGKWHGLASADIHGGTIDVLGQWVRTASQSTRLEDLGTLTVRYAANRPDLATTREGIAPQAGLTLTYQSRNRAIVFAKPHANRDWFMEAVGKEGLSQLATVVGLWNFADSKDWEIFVDGQKVEAFPHRLTGKQRILIRDGVSYLAILPLPTADLGRDAEIEIGPGIGGKSDQMQAEIAPALVISIYNLKRDKPVDGIDFDAIAHRTYGGFVLEMGDAAQHGSFDAFAAYIKANQLTAQWHEDRHLMEVSYRTGNDLMEVAFGTDFTQPGERHFVLNPGQQEKAIPYRRLNGQWPYLPPGLERDTTWAQQGTTGRLEKNGATLTTEPGKKSYLLSDPITGAIVGYNPLPDPQDFALTHRDGLTLRADGKVGLLRVEYRPWTHEIEITHALKPDQSADAFAKTFSVTGLGSAPRVTLNGRPVEARRAGNAFQIAAL
ncbi:hypothetical protein [Enhydrobacter aerosaccus]|uniref:hypothetical protein n=1 Tax=Enhydrobacter aerosaccus TaxID=225324 RepID=UPI0011168394|nr:hypothetical protein [Enhydrobacter aerosaccus]